jgi:hypothetical protein
MCILCLVQLHVLASFPFCEPGPRVFLFVLVCVLMHLFALKCSMVRFHMCLFIRQQLYAGASQFSAGSNSAPVHLNCLALVAQVQDERNVFHKSGICAAHSVFLLTTALSFLSEVLATRSQFFWSA